jgi:hypothetical protein
MDFQEALESKKELIKQHPTAMQDINDLDDYWQRGEWGAFAVQCKLLASYGLGIFIDDNGPHVQMYQKIYPNIVDSEYIDNIIEKEVKV